MSFKNRRELLFVYTVNGANPNGDPLNANHPRYDEDTGKLLVSDVRIKRTVRDQWLREGHKVFVDGEPKTLKTRADELREALEVKTGKEIMGLCVDTRLFGVTFALGKESFSWTGPVQFAWGRSLNRSRVEMVQGTAAFATKESSDQRSFRNEYYVPFAMIGVYGIANQHASTVTGATDKDLDLLVGGLWDGTANLITRSKMGHQPRLILEVTYKEGFNGIAGSLDDHLEILNLQDEVMTDEQQLSLRSLGDLKLNLAGTCEAILRHVDNIEKVKVVYSHDLTLLGLETLKPLGNRLEVEKR